jgi:hypothetical protein
MLITDVIREAVDEHEVYFLLNAYLEAVRYCDTLSLLPAAIRELPLRGIEDAVARARLIRSMLDSHELMSGEAQVVAAEAEGVLAAAVQRLESLRTESLGSLPVAA